MKATALVATFASLFFVVPCAAQLRIACVGDSITHGFTADHPSYRAPLWNLLNNSCVDFVGRRIGCTGVLPSDPIGAVPTGTEQFDEDHEGWSGRSVADLFNDLMFLGGTLPPADLYILELGANDLLRNNTPPALVAAGLHWIVGWIANAHPTATIVVCTLLPADPTEIAGYNQNYNLEAASLNAWMQTGFPAGVLIATPDVGFNAKLGADTFDGLHPNASGELKYAQAVHSVIGPMLIGPSGFACFKEFGMGCPYVEPSGQVRAPRLRQNTGRPIVGSSFDLRIDDLPTGSAPAIVWSVNPVTRTFLGPSAPGCTALVDIVNGTWVVPLPSTTWTWPHTTTYVGVDVFVQGVALGGGYNALDVLNTNAGIIRAGTF